MSWKEDISLRDLDDDAIIEITCIRCLYTWRQSPVQLLLRADHRDVRLDELEKGLQCAQRRCRHVGVKITLLRRDDTSGFVGGMP